MCLMLCSVRVLLYLLPPPHPTLLFCLLLVCPLVKWGGGGGPPSAPHSHWNRWTQHCQSAALGNFPEFSGKTCHKYVISPPCPSCPLAICGSGVFSGFTPSLHPLPPPVLHSPQPPSIMPAFASSYTPLLSWWDWVEPTLNRVFLSLPGNLRIQKSGVRSQESGVRSQESGVWSLEWGVWSEESGVRSQHIPSTSSRLCGYWLQTILSARNEQKYYINPINETIWPLKVSAWPDRQELYP